MEIRKKKFGSLKTGEEVYKYILQNDKLEVGILNYGGIITEIYMEDLGGNRENIVLGYDNILDYEEKSPHFGAITGRTAGRISGAKFEIDGETYNLTKNNGENNLHGGDNALDKRIWDVKEILNGIELSYKSLHLEEGYPGEVDFKVKYTLVGDILEIEYLGVSDRKTIINLTNHSYFNLSGDCKEDILEHKLKIDSDFIVLLDKEGCPYGDILDVSRTPFDFRRWKKIGEDIGVDNQYLRGVKGYDHPYILNKKRDKPRISLCHEKSGRRLDIVTNQRVVVFYSSNFLEGGHGILSSGVEARERLGVCLETQDIPNNINVENFRSEIYSKDKNYVEKTQYIFTNEK